MDSLGQVKIMLELQAMRGLSGQDKAITATDSTFGSFLEEAFLSVQDGPLVPGAGTNSFPFLGQVFRMSQLGIPSPLSANSSTSFISQLPYTNKADNGGIGVVPGTAGNLESIIQKAADRYKLPAKLIKSVIRHESNFNSEAVSKAGASGLMQLMPGTARGLGVTDIFNPEQNVMAGSKYLRSMLDRYDGNLALALAAYNAGPGNVDKHGGIPPFKETQAYVKKVSATYYG